MLQVKSTKHEFDPALAHSFAHSFSVIRTLPWRQPNSQFSTIKSRLLNSLKDLFGFCSSFSPPINTNIPGTQLHNGIPYVKLNSEYRDSLRKSWTNNPNKLYLESCFDPRLDVNLAKDFNITGLCPVVKATQDDLFILRDANDQYYLWDAWTGKLSVFHDTWTKGFASKEELVSNIVCNMTWAEMDTETIYRPRLSD